MVEEDRGDLRAFIKVAQVARGAVELFELLRQLRVDGVRFLVGGLDLLLGGFELLVGGLKFFVDRVQLPV